MKNRIFFIFLFSCFSTFNYSQTCLSEGITFSTQQQIDDFATEGNITIQNKFLPIFEEYNRNYLNASSRGDKKEETETITTFSGKIQQIMFEANKDLIRIKQETNTIRLIASNKIIKTLDQLELAYDESFEISSNVLRELPALILVNNQEEMALNQTKLFAVGETIKILRDNLINQMRIELDEI